MRIATAVAFLVLLATLASPSTSVMPSVKAASNCEGGSAPEWNTTLQRLALVPHASYGGPFYYEDVYYEEEDDRKEPAASSQGDEWNPALHPEEAYMYNPVWPLPTLDPLTTGQYAVMEIGNDSSGVLRMNLSSTHRTTFCITLYEMVDNATVPASADVYLMTTSQYNSYEEVYRMMHGGWWWGDLDIAGGDSDLLSDIPPEWRSFNPLGWQSYRDVHQYEQRTEVTFSLALDSPEVYSSLFGGSEWQDFYLVIDAWDNTNDGDQGASNSVLVADVTIVPTERSVLLPPWTVPLTLFVLLATVVIVPVVMNKRYMQAGLDGNTTGQTTVPVMEQAATRETDEPVSIP